jgi:peroxiredoxin
MIPLILFLAFFQSPQRTAPLRDGCSMDDPQILLVTASDRGDGVCYHIDVARDGKTISGDVLGEALPAISAFVEERERLTRESLEAAARQAEIDRQAELARQAAEARQAAAARLAVKNGSVKPAAPAADAPVFDNFSGRDLRGKPVSLASLPGSVIVVQFWTPRGSSKGELMSLVPLYNQYRHRGLSVIGLAVGTGAKGVGEALDDITLPFPQIADPGLAQRYGVNPRVGKTFVLDQSHRVISAGSAADAIRTATQLLSAISSR